MKNLFNMTFVTLLIFISLSCQQDPVEPTLTCEEQLEELRINEIQTIGSHNSYRIRTPEPIMQFMYASPELLPDDFDPKHWDFSHLNLIDQFEDYGIRSVEIDVYRDPEGGRFYIRKGNAFVGMNPVSNEDDLLQPGLKVLHFPDFDYMSHYLTFAQALTEIKTWSDENPRHLPISILVEAKEDSPDLMLPGYGLTSTLAFDETGVEEIENEINAIFGLNSKHIIRPDDIRGEKETLNQAVLDGDWPKLKEARGKIIFILMADDQAIQHYVEGHASLNGRNMFVFTDPGKAESAFLTFEDPQVEISQIQKYIQEGYFVRTRADADTYEARVNDHNRRDMAFSSGAQIISTDYYKSDDRATTNADWSLYKVAFPNGELALINPRISSIPTVDCAITD